MKIDSFRVFCDVVLHQSFSRGAEINKISQSAATQSIHRLEQQFDIPLIDRSKRPFALTPEGKICYESFREIVETYDSLLARIESLQDRSGGQIKVAAIYSIGLHEMSRFMQNFMKSYPKVKIKLEFLPPPKVYQSVLNAEVDFGVISYPIPSVEISVIPLRSEEMVVVVPTGHPLAKEKMLTMERLEGVDYIAFDRDLMIRKETDRCFRQRGVSVNVVMEFDNIETIKQAIEIGLGISILPAPTVQSDVESGKMVAIPLFSPKLSRPIGIIYKQHKVFSPTAIRFIELLSGTSIPKNAPIAAPVETKENPER